MCSLFCPACLNDGAYFRRCWRLEFFLLCNIHGVLLQDYCSGCRAWNRSHLMRSPSPICHSCGFDLSKAELRCSRSPRSQDFLILEQRLTRVLEVTQRDHPVAQTAAGSIANGEFLDDFGLVNSALL
jgi:hypothetical protein